jgi:hypothetical protein
MGSFNLNASVNLAKGLGAVLLKLYGEASSLGPKKVLITGTDKLPDNFAVQYKFVDPEAAAEVRVEKRQTQATQALQLDSSLRVLVNKTRKGTTGMVDLTKGVDMSEKKLDESLLQLQQHSSLLDVSQDRDEIYDLDNHDTRFAKTKCHSQSATNLATDEQVMFEQRREHNRKYNAFLQRSQAQRELHRLAETKLRALAKGAIDFGDPDSINMGMERNLDEPALHIPPAEEPLWLASTTHANARANAIAGCSGPSKLVIDDNRLIQKKYSSSPKTQAEGRDCSVELSPHQLKQVISSHKVIDFGKVCVGSVMPKCFAVLNGLKQSILVGIEDLEVELQQSKALQQIIPAGCMAGFDISFSSRVLGKVKKAFTWKINGIHLFMVHITADVVPIELQLNKRELIMEFPSDLLKPTLTSEVVLTNPGNIPLALMNQRICELIDDVL